MSTPPPPKERSVPMPVLTDAEAGALEFPHGRAAPSSPLDDLDLKRPKEL
jgi:hypothetical protein